jgi:ATP-binding cassette, subfamily B, bacterial
VRPRPRDAAAPAKLSVRLSPGAFAYAPRTLGLVLRAAPMLTMLFGVATLAAALLPLGVAWVGKGIIDAVVARDAHAALVRVGIELTLVAGLALASQGLALLRAVLGARLSLDINVLILEKAVELELRHFEDSEFYDRLTRARREASTRPLSVVSRTFQIAQAGLTLAGYGALLVRWSPFAVLLLLAATIPATVAEVRFSTQAFRLRNWRSPESRRLMYFEYVLANDEHAKEVKLFGLGPLFLGRYKALGKTFHEEDVRLNVTRSGWGYTLSLLATLAFYGAYALMALRAAAGAMSIGEMTLYMVSFRQGQQAFQSVLSAFSGMYEDNLYMSNLFAFLGSDDGDAEGEARPVDLGATKREGEKGIRFEGVGFQYAGSDTWALRHIDLFIGHGESLALVGKNGAGKTTFIKLLTRLYDPTEGRILLDGKDLRAWDRDALHARIAVVFQDFAEYQLSLAENVGLGDVNAIDLRPQIERAADRGGATSVAEAVKGGYEAPLGRWFKDGVELSGGQWQKVALSRAFMREAADILVLDEPTAALDAESEHATFERFRALTRGKTSLLISHRFPTVRMADRIVVVEAGEIVEEGTHEALVARGGRYAAMFALQASGYA